MQYWVDWDNCCIVFGEVVSKTKSFCIFKDLSENNYIKVPLKDVCSDLKEAELSLLSHFKNV